VPLVACDPYFSIWSPADKLTDADTVHWTGKPHQLTSLIRIDGKPFRIMGKEPANVPSLTQTNLEVLLTRTIYTFDDAGVKLTLTFMTAALPEDLLILSRPVTYLIWQAQATDGKTHRVAFDFGASPDIAVNEPDQQKIRTMETNADFVISKIGSREQPILQKKGDDIRIDWGHFYIATPLNFMSEENCGSKPLSRWLILAYDDEFSIQYMRKNLRPYWRRNGDNAAALLTKAAADYESLRKRCEAFDTELMADLRKAGGEKYARLGALAYRQCFAAGKFVADANGQPLSSARKTIPMAASVRAMCSIRWRRNSCCSGRRWRSHSLSHS